MNMHVVGSMAWERSQQPGTFSKISNPIFCVSGNNDTSILVKALQSYVLCFIFNSDYQLSASAAIE